MVSASKRPIPEPQEMVAISLIDIRKELQCPICLGIIRRTRTVMECLHRFCGDCIDKAIRLGNNECPSCRAHCASRRSLRADPRFDALVAAVFPNRDRIEKEEMTLHTEEARRNEELPFVIIP
ncbi:hypothetical protein CLOM_g812 [Closterium sp. NIES-68]|nr:hypothetical protein CLOM_g812 [Closterium sp. NIES-68]